MNGSKHSGLYRFGVTRLARAIPIAIFMVLGLLACARATSESGPQGEGFSLTGVDRLMVEGFFFRVIVEGHSRATVEARISIPDRLEKRGVRVLHEQRGSELRVWVERPAMFIPSVRGETALIELSVPTKTDLKVANGSGSVDVSGLTSTDVNLEVSSGSLIVRDVTTTLTAKSSSGRITLERCQGSKDLKAASGKISVSGSNGDIKVHSSSGSHSYTSIQGSITAESSSGRITISGSEGILDLKSDSGGLTGTDVNITGASSFRTTSGAISFDFTNDMDDFAFSLESSSGTISAGDTRAKGTVRTGGGPISIRGKSSSGRQTYK